MAKYSQVQEKRGNKYFETTSSFCQKTFGFILTQFLSCLKVIENLYHLCTEEKYLGEKEELKA